VSPLWNLCNPLLRTRSERFRPGRKVDVFPDPTPQIQSETGDQELVMFVSGFDPPANRLDSDDSRNTDRSHHGSRGKGGDILTRDEVKDDGRVVHTKVDSPARAKVRYGDGINTRLGPYVAVGR
jgi:hypothetical protein